MPKPILAAGVLVGDEIMLYGERDFIGVESTGSTTPRGINEVAAWTQRVKSSAIVEHDENGVHDTPRIARGLVHIFYDSDTGTYAVNPYTDSYLMGTYYSDDPTIFSCATIGDGVFDLTLGIAMPSINYGIVDMCRPRLIFDTDTTVDWVTVTGAPTSTTVIRITRRSGDVDADGYNGPCAFLLCG